MSGSLPAVRRVLLGVSGAIAAYKAADVVRGLRAHGVEVTVTMTRNAHHFVTPFLLGNLAGRPVITDPYAPELSDVHHVDLALEVGLLLIAPATADLLARMSAGLADDFLTTFYLATPAPVLIAPAMNTRMWEHPATRRNVELLRERGVRFIGPTVGELATMHQGIGRLADPAEIVAQALARLTGGGPLDGRVVLVTSGRTEEDLDLARTLTNRSTGRMGHAVAAEAAARGARVTLIAGPTELTPPSGVELVRVRSSAEMRDAVLARSERAEVIVMAAAVADFRPAERAPGKIKKDQASLTLELVRTQDILAELGAHKGNRLLVGFAAEDREVEARAREKLERKRLDLVVGNDIGRADTGFAADDNEVVILARDGVRVEVSKRPKRAVAAALMDQVERLLAAGRVR